MTETIQVRRLPITPEVREFVFKRDRYACRYCGSKNQPFHLDHVYPVSKGGETSIDNLVTSCVYCNAKKHASIGIWPKPVGYFEKKDIIEKESLIPIWDGILVLISSILLIDFVRSVLYGDTTLATIEVYSAAIIVLFPVYRLIKSSIIDFIKAMKD